MVKFFYSAIAALFLAVPILAQAKECRYCQTGEGASPRGHGYAECRVNMPLPAGATKLAIQLKKDGRDIFEEPRVAGPKDGKVVVGCGIFENADVLIACAEWEGGKIKKTTTLYRKNGRLDNAVRDRLLVVPL